MKIYGTTKQYAAWIDEALNAGLLERSCFKPERLFEYDNGIDCASSISREYLVCQCIATNF